MPTTALIPARSGSKRLPGKNGKLFHGKPLIYWSIQAALNCPAIQDVLVSTDCPKIGSYAESLGANVPELRPYDLCTDTATSAAVAIYSFKYISSHDLILLQPTSPIRSSIDIQNFYNYALNNNISSLVSCFDAKHYVSLYSQVYNPSPPLIHSAPVYLPNGSMYYIKKDLLLKHQSFIPKGFTPYPMDKMHSIDIDTHDDWDLAYACFQSLGHQ